jgi:hypothetical protein
VEGVEGSADQPHEDAAGEDDERCRGDGSKGNRNAG